MKTLVTSPITKVDTSDDLGSIFGTLLLLFIVSLFTIYGLPIIAGYQDLPQVDGISKEKANILSVNRGK